MVYFFLRPLTQIEEGVAAVGSEGDLRCRIMGDDWGKSLKSMQFYSLALTTRNEWESRQMADSGSKVCNVGGLIQ